MPKSLKNTPCKIGLKEYRGPSFDKCEGETIAYSYPPCGNATEIVDLVMKFETNTAKRRS